MGAPTVSRVGFSWRVVILGLLGIACGVIVSPALAAMTGGAAQAIGPAATGRWVSCPGMSFYPGSDSSYSSIGGERHGDGFLNCGLTLPHGATVTAVKFHLYDEVSNEQIHHCSLNRVRLDPPNGTTEELAGPLGSGVGFNSGYITRSDQSIEHKLVNNRLYAYYAQCVLKDSPAFGFAIIGVSVRYTPA